jgi:hypothetical protein
MRLGIFVVMLMWTLDKFVNPAHSMAVFERFYPIPGLNETLTYGVIFLLHGGSTLSA